MVYEIDGKNYIMANHRFYEVKVEKKGENDFDVKLVKNGKTLEFKREETYKQVTLEEVVKGKKSHNLD